LIRNSSIVAHVGPATLRDIRDDRCTLSAGRSGYEETGMKVLAMLTLVPEAKLETVRDELADELRGSWALYSSGVLREVYATEDSRRVVFVMEADHAAAAKRLLAPLPLVAAEELQMEFVELRPFVNWSMLFAH
jgi:hypothetical protein